LRSRAELKVTSSIVRERTRSRVSSSQLSTHFLFLGLPTCPMEPRLTPWLGQVCNPQASHPNPDYVHAYELAQPGHTEDGILGWSTDKCSLPAPPWPERQLLSTGAWTPASVRWERGSSGLPVPERLREVASSSAPIRPSQGKF
jgi:hypothetical protein